MKIKSPAQFCLFLAVAGLVGCAEGPPAQPDEPAPLRVSSFFEATQSPPSDGNVRHPESVAAFVGSPQPVYPLREEVRKAPAFWIRVSDRGSEAIERANEVDLQNYLTPPAPAADQAQSAITTSVATVHFQVGKSILLDKAAIGSVTGLAKTPDARVSIVGNTDSSGTEKLNKKLSLHRAEAAKNALVKAGVNENAISLSGAADSNPVASNKTAAGRAKNRRADIIVTAPLSKSETAPDEVDHGSH